MLGARLRDGMMALQDSLEYMSCRIIKSNHIPNWDAQDSTPGSPTPTYPYQKQVIGEARYNLDFLLEEGGALVLTTGTRTQKGVKGMIWQSKAIASLSHQGMKVDSVEDIRRNTNFTVASMMAGTGVLRPECASLIYAGDKTSGTVASSKSEIMTALGGTAEYVKTT